MNNRHEASPAGVRWKSHSWVTALLAGLLVGACAAPMGPRLTLVLVVDQMRADYLDRFGPQFTAGLARLRDRGAVFTDAHQDHGITTTAPGHATISTGVFPSRHGIVGNQLYYRTSETFVYAIADPTKKIIGLPRAPGRSPANLLRPALGDWLEAESPGSKVFAVAMKDRSAVLLGGKTPDGAYWFHAPTGRFVTSAYYRERNPEWLDAFNESGRAARYHGTEWSTLLDEAAYGESREDDFPPEAGRRTFPHPLGRPGREPGLGYYEALQRSPFAAELTLDFARQLILEEDVGADDVPDLLFVGLSSADFVGHAYGPYSREVEDYYLRIDRYLGDFFAFLDERIGPDGYLVALSADHGVMPMPEELARRGGGVDARRVDPVSLLPGLRTAVADAASKNGIVATPEVGIDLYGVTLRFDSTHPSVDKQRVLRAAVADYLNQRDEVVAAYPYDAFLSADANGEYFEQFRRSFHPDRSTDVLVAYRENYLLTNVAVGTSHGTPHRYDTHVPLVFAGPGIVPGERNEFVRTVDLAPTLASLLDIRPPPDLDGNLLNVVH